MPGRFENTEPDRRHPPQRRRKKKWQYYLPTIIVMLLAIVCVVTVTVAVVAVLGNKDDVQLSSPDNPATIRKDDSTTNTEPSGPCVDLDKMIQDADFVAAGYDYQKAISMLKAYEDYENTPALIEKVAEYEKEDRKLVTYSSPETVTHIFFPSLIVDTNRAFDGDED